MGRARQGFHGIASGRRVSDSFAGVFGVGRGLNVAQRAERERDGEGYLEVDETSGRITKYYLNNAPKTKVLHREGGPATIRITARGARIETYYDHGTRHREGGPAQTVVTANGSRIEYYYVRGQYHREGGPAIVETINDDGIDEGGYFEKYFVEGNLHRVDGPALIERRNNGSSREEWYLRGQLHRVGGCAKLFVAADGTREEEWWQRGLKGVEVMVNSKDGRHREYRYGDGLHLHPEVDRTALW